VPNAYCRFGGVTKTGLLVLAAGVLSLCFAQSAPAPAAPGNVPASGTASAAVQVTSQGDQIEVKVPDQAPLSNVMSSLCQQQKIKCTGTETLASYHGPAMLVDGTLRQVIGKLVEGTDINYEFSRSAEGGATAIAFLGHAPKGTSPVPSAAEPPPTQPFTPLHSRPFPGNPPAQAAPPPAPAPAPQSELMTPPAVAEPQSDSVAVDPQEAQRSQQAATILFTGSGNPDTGVLPFPDQYGNPIPKSDQAPTVLPFPDQNGKPIPVKPSQGGSPFPVKPSPPNTGSSAQQ